MLYELIGLFLPLVGLLCVLGTGWLAGFGIAKLPFYQKLLASQANGRFASLDGIRGFLALSVFVHHLNIHREFLASGVWLPPRDAVIRMAGPAPVQIFFMITGFLFWSRAIDQGARIDWRKLAVSRVCRIAPLYAFAMLASILIALHFHGYRAEIDEQQVARLVIDFLTFGAIRIWTVGDIDLMPVNAGVTWTLVLEWGFYIALPILAWFANSRRVPWLFAGFLLLLALRQTFEIEHCLFFAVGMATAHLRPLLLAQPWLRSRSAGGLVLFLLLGVYVSGGKLDHLLVGVAFLAPVFMILAAGNDLFGLLVTPSSRALGNASYSIYLLHGPLLFVLLQGVVGPKAALALPMPAYWLLGCGIAVILCAVSALTYWAIEHPMIELGKRASGRPRARRQ